MYQLREKISGIHLIVSKEEYSININIVCRLIRKDNRTDHFYVFNYIYNISSNYLLISSLF